MNATVSRQLLRLPSERICVKVFNHGGDEVQEALDV
jgi:hypothetical protein